MPLPYIVAAITTKASRPVRFAYQGTHSTAQEAQEQVIAETMMQRYRLPLIREVPIPSEEEAVLPQPIAYYYLASEVDAFIAQLKAKAEEALSAWESCDTRAGLGELIGLMDSVTK
jgi:hypothetical protein